MQFVIACFDRFLGQCCYFNESSGCFVVFHSENSAELSLAHATKFDLLAARKTMRQMGDWSVFLIPVNS